MSENTDNRRVSSGRKVDQKMKPFLVYEYLMRASDESHIVIKVWKRN